MKSKARHIAAILVLIAAIGGVRAISGVALSDLGIPRLFSGPEDHDDVVPFEPSSPAIVRAMLRLAAVNKDDLLYDLGSGDGRIVIAAARTTGARAIGVDIDAELIAESRRNAERSNVGQLVQFRKEDLSATDISKATVVMLYLSPDANLKLRPRLLKELKPGARIVSHLHRMGDWKPDSETEVENHFIYCWVVPADVSGRWSLEVADKYAESEYSLEFKQNYQEVQAAMTTRNGGVPITRASLKGTKVRFTAGRQFGSLSPPIEFTGEAAGDRIAGRFKARNHSGGWTARRVK